MEPLPRFFSRNSFPYALAFCLIIVVLPTASTAQSEKLCLDGFCIGQTIHDPHFDQVAWITPTKNLTVERCSGVGCQPAVAFRGYPREDQLKLAEAVSLTYQAEIYSYSVLTNDNLATLRRYKYECNPSARGLSGERRFFGAYKSAPSQYLTVVGLRLINGELTVYRVARQYPYHNQAELVSLAKEVRAQYGEQVLLFDGISSNAYADVITQRKDGWFGHSTLFNPTDLSDNAAELVLIDPTTRVLLEPTSIPESGEIKPLSANLPPICSAPVPLQ
jgi:hypothetical protein